jgi:hypothetical protein
MSRSEWGVDVVTYGWVRGDRRSKMSCISVCLSASLDSWVRGESAGGTSSLPLPDAHAAANDDTLIDDARALARMDAHVRAILASAGPMLYALNTTLGHTVTRTVPPPLTDETMAAEIAELYA